MQISQLFFVLRGNERVNQFLRDSFPRAVLSFSQLFICHWGIQHLSSAITVWSTCGHRLGRDCNMPLFWGWDVKGTCLTANGRADAATADVDVGPLLISGCLSIMWLFFCSFSDAWAKSWSQGIGFVQVPVRRKTITDMQPPERICSCNKYYGAIAA